ncbi:MAG: DUF6122 family protein [Arenicellales bacterium]|jgi:hypothetical protein
MSLMATVVHMAAHFLLPGALARVFFANRWRVAWLIMVATMAVDLDHLLANPIFDPNRCSIGFHPLHSYPAIALYVGALWFRPFRVVAAGLLIHMLIDGADCLRMMS